MKAEVWAHRGASGYAPENTMEAFALAVQMQADGVELDVQLSKDGKLIVMHDETIDRVCDGSGKVGDYTLRELKEFCVNKPFAKYSDAKIPTLQEVYELLRDTQLVVNVELKTGIYFYPGIEEAVLKLASDFGMEERIWYSSFNHYSVRKIKQISPASKCGILYADGIYRAVDYAKSLGVEAVHPALYYVNYPDFIKDYKAAGLRAHIWTVNEKEHMKLLRDLGVEALITNYPDLARSVVDI